MTAPRKPLVALAAGGHPPRAGQSDVRPPHPASFEPRFHQTTEAKASKIAMVTTPNVDGSPTPKTELMSGTSEPNTPRENLQKHAAAGTLDRAPDPPLHVAPDARAGLLGGPAHCRRKAKSRGRLRAGGRLDCK